MANPIGIDYRFKGNATLGGGTTDISLTATVQDFKNKIKSKYKFDLNDYCVIYNGRLREDNQRFSQFWLEDTDQDVLLFKRVAYVEFGFQDSPHLGVDAVEIPITYTGTDFKNAIRDDYPYLDLNKYRIFYNSAMIGDSKKFFEFWSEEPVREIHLARDSESACFT